MSTAMLKKLREEYDNKVSFMEGLTETAVKENRDMTTNELELVTRSQDRIAALKAQIDVLAVDVSISAESQKRLDTISSAVTSPNSATGGVEYRSAGHFLQDYLRSLIGEGEQRVEASDRIKRYQRAAAHITTGEFTGVFPQALVGPVVNLINTSRPLVSALGPIGVPSGPSFRRPVLNDPNIATGVAPQVNQKDELVSKQFTITSSNVDLVTLGGYVNVSRQLLDWGVASMDTIVRQLAARYAYAVERAAVAELGESTGHEPLPADADSAATIQAIYNAAAKVYEATGSLPTILAAGPLGWARLGGLSDLGGRQIFPFMAPANAGGQMSADSLAGNPVGLRLVVTPGITDNTYWVLNDMALEVYEQVVGQLSIVEPSVLGVQVSFSGYTGMFRPAPNGAIHIAP